MTNYILGIISLLEDGPCIKIGVFEIGAVLPEKNEKRAVVFGIGIIHSW